MEEIWTVQQMANRMAPGLVEKPYLQIVVACAAAICEYCRINRDYQDESPFIYRGDDSRIHRDDDGDAAAPRWGRRE